MYGVESLNGVDETQGLHFGLFGGQEEGIGESGQWVRNSASLKPGSMSGVICLGSGLRTATPFENKFCHVTCYR